MQMASVMILDWPHMEMFCTVVLGLYKVMYIYFSVASFPGVQGISRSLSLSLKISNVKTGDYRWYLVK